VLQGVPSLFQEKKDCLFFLRRGKRRDRQINPCHQKSIDRNPVAMRSEDFWLLAKFWRGRMPVAACNRAETRPKAKKTAPRRATGARYKIDGNALTQDPIKYRPKPAKKWNQPLI
jgi:hypothetical protein